MCLKLITVATTHQKKWRGEDQRQRDVYNCRPRESLNDYLKQVSMSVEERELTEDVGERIVPHYVVENERKKTIKSNPGQLNKITKSWFDSYLCKYMT